MKNYIAVIHKDGDSDYGVSFPDFAGCVTAGATVDEAKDMAQEALEMHIEGMREEGESIPAPSQLESLIANPDFAGAVAYFVVGIKSPASDKAIRFNATLPESLLQDIDAYAKRHGLSRSGFLARAAAHEIGKVT